MLFKRGPQRPPMTRQQIMLASTYLAHRERRWAWEETKKELGSAKLNSTVKPKFKPWLAYHE